MNSFVLHPAPNTACTGRLGLGAFFELVLSYDSFPFPVRFLSSRR
jgi:hypothetical protein